MKRRLSGHATLLLSTALLLGGAGLLLSPASAQQTALVNVQPVSLTIDYSDGAFNVRVELSNLNHHGLIAYDTNRDGITDREEPSDGLGAYELSLYFDANVVRVARMEAGEFLRSGGRSTQCLQRAPEPGQFVIGCVSTGGAEGPQGSGNLAVLTLEPVANGMSFLGLEAELAGPLGDSIDAGADSGVVEVYNGPAVPPTSTPRPPTDGGTPRPTATQDPGPDGTPGTSDDPTPRPPAAATVVAAATATARAAGGTPDPDATTPAPSSLGGDGDGGGGLDAGIWIISAIGAVVTAGALLFASRLIIRARTS